MNEHAVSSGPGGPIVGLCIYNYPWTVSPSILNMALLLSEAGYQVDMLVGEMPEGPKPLSQARIRLEVFGGDTITTREMDQPLPRSRAWLRQMLPRQVFDVVRVPRRIFWSMWIEYLWFRRMWRYAVWLQRQSQRRSYATLIGMDQAGFIPAMWAGWRSCVPTVYYSLELHLAGEDGQIRSYLLKYLERLAHRRAAWTIVQDRERAAHLADNNWVRSGDFVLLPVAAQGAGTVEKSDLLQGRLGIPDDKLVVLSAGGIAHWSLCVELARVAQLWPDNWVLVIHGYVPDPSYLGELQPLVDHDRVFLSTDLVPYEELDALIGSAHIGIALYKDLGPNFQHIALSSGKLAQYLKVGLPVVATDFPDVRRLMTTEKCGVAISSPEEVRSAIGTILSDMDNYRLAAYSSYEKHYNMRTHFHAVLERLNPCADMVSNPLIGWPATTGGEP